MQIPHEIQGKQQIGSERVPTISAKWIASFICLLSIALVGIFTYHQKALSTGIVAEPTLQPIPQSGYATQAKDMERAVKSVHNLATKPSIWPTSGEVTSGFGWRVSPWGGGNELHQGLDIANNEGTPIVATADGKVVKSEFSEGYGNHVQLDHGNGIETIYAHNAALIVKVGQSVKKGEIISYLGNTGRSTGPHLHYEVRVNNTPIDPIGFLVMY